MSASYIALFPGQGSQSVGMGQDLFAADQSARVMFEQADETLGFKISEIMFAGPLEQLVKTELVQPAILICSCVAFELAKKRLLPNQMLAVAGHSLGEYSALVAAGAIDFIDAVKLVNKRGQYMQAAVPLGEGKMIAVLGMELADLEDKLATVSGVAEVANINAPGQIVVSGSAAVIDQVKELLVGVRLIELTVSAPFHCSLMKPAADQLALELDKLKIKPASVPVYANFLATPIQQPEQIRQALKDQVCGRVRWSEIIVNLRNTYSDAQFVEFGVGGVLGGLLRRIDRTAQKHSAGELSEIESLSVK